MSNFLRRISNRLERFPRLWQIIIRLYGIRSFSQERIRYRKRSKVFEDEKAYSSKFEVIFDAQCLQTLTRQRGIGKYSLSLIEAMCKVAPEKEFAAYLTNIADRAELNIAKELLTSLECPNLSVLVLNPFESSNKISLAQSQEFLESSLSAFAPKVVISLSNFEKPSSAIPLPPSSTYKTSAILYDLIPLQYSDYLLISRQQETSYRWLLANLQKFDYLFSISNTTKEIWGALVSKSSLIKVISGAGYQHVETESLGFAHRFGILCVGAEQQHKNLERLISAYSMLLKNIQVTHSLTIVGIRSNGARRKLAKFARRLNCDVLLPQYLTEAALRTEYRSNRILIMPSLSEGLSLPILEAWANGLPAIGSSGTVADELIQEKALLFDPKNTYSMAQVIEVLLLSEVEWNKAILGARTNAKNYSWARTADLALSAIREFGEHG